MGLEISEIGVDLSRQVDAQIAKKSFRHFIEFVQPDYVFNWHHLVLIDALQRLAERKYSRLIVMMPPRHGKSRTVSDLFPAWMLARNPDEQVIAASYALDLASFFNRQCQSTISTDAYRSLFHDTRLRDIGQQGIGVRNNHRFDIIGRKGHYISSGIGGGITGAGATVAIIDDPVKDAAQADSATVRNSIWEWYTTTFKTRFEPGCIEVICQTRWHEDDLTGRVLAQYDGGATVGQTEVISFPALCEAEETNRNVGEALWPEKFSRPALLSIKEDGGSRSWNALYQQRPAPDEGSIIKRQWFQYYNPREYKIEGKRVNFYFDTAYTEKEKNDPTAGIAYVKERANFYILECTAEWLDFSGQIQFVKDFAARNGYSTSSIIRVEPKATGISLVQVMKKETGLNVTEGKPPKGDKVARAHSCEGTLEGGRVYLPQGMSWVGPFLDECAAFPNAAHDDRVDCLTGMITSESATGIRVTSTAR